MNRYLRERRRQDEFDNDIYNEGYLDELEEDDEISSAEAWFMIGYSGAAED